MTNPDGKAALVEPRGSAAAGDSSRSLTAATPVTLLSVVIPTLNEARHLAAAVASATAPGVEIVVADGGSVDGTIPLAEGLGVRVVRAERGRGRQLAAGADAASADLLLFLHADAVLPAGYAQEVRRTLADPQCAVGAFRLRIDSRGLCLRVIEWGARMRSRWLGIPYGDQALFVRTADYRSIGGFSALPMMEDLEFVRSARRLGRVRTLRSAVVVSPRSWRTHGVLRFTLCNVLCALAVLLGVSPLRVARFRARALAKGPVTVR